MANIIEEILRATGSDDTPQETKDALRKAFARKFIEETDSDVTISYTHKKGKNDQVINIEGLMVRVEFGACKLLAQTARQLGQGDKQRALRKVDDICEYAKKLINDVGGGIEDAQNCAEEAEG